MDTFSAVVLLLVLYGFGCYTAGHFFPQKDIAESCNKTGEMVIRNTVFSCKAIALQADGRKSPLNP